MQLLFNVEAVASDHIATMTLDIVIVFHTTLAFLTSMVTQVMSPCLMWRGKHVLNFCVLQRVHFLLF
jgi:hypothetical protein